MDVKLEPDYVSKTFRPLFRCISRTTILSDCKDFAGCACDGLECNGPALVGRGIGWANEQV